MSSCLQWEYGGNENSPLGYAYVARSMREGFRQLGYKLDRLSRTVVFHTVPWTGYEWYPGQQAAIYTMWEHSRLPEGIATAIEMFDLAMVPCRFSAELMAPHAKVEVVPHGIDPSTYYPPSFPKERPEALTVMTAATNLRKGTPEVVEGFKRAGVPGRVICKGRKARRMTADIPGIKDIELELIEGRVDSMASLYRKADLYVSGSRGEGWDLIAWEALACGVPTIVPDHTGYRDWNHLAQGVLERARAEESPVRIFGDPGQWWVADPDEIAEQITWVWENYDTVARQACNAAYSIRRNQTWKDVCRTAVEALERHGYELEPFAPEGEIEKHIPLVRVRCLRHMEPFNVGPYSSPGFKKDAIYNVPPEVARVLTESGAVRPED